MHRTFNCVTSLQINIWYFFSILNQFSSHFIICVVYDCKTFRKLKPRLLENKRVAWRANSIPSLNHVSYLKFLNQSVLLMKKI
jgi:hypothetical protein